MNRIIYLFGPSCSGKSTLGEALQQRLGEPWIYLDRDNSLTVASAFESTADQTLEEKIQAIGSQIIVDAQIPWAEKTKEAIYCLLLPRLEILCKRDAQRTELLNRSERRAFYARD